MLESVIEESFHLGIIVGHTARAQGAVMPKSGTTEYQYNKEIAKRVEMYAKQAAGLKVTTIFRDGIGVLGAYKLAQTKKCDAVIELHFNAFNSKAKGTLTITSTYADDINFGRMVHNMMCRVFGRDRQSMGSRSIGRSARGAENVYAMSGGANCLVEPFFGDSEEELGLSLMDEYAQGLVTVAQEWAVAKNIISRPSM